MDLRRARHGEWIAGVAGVVLIVALFLDWYSTAGVTVNAWDAFTTNDVILAIAALMGMVLLVAVATQKTPAMPQAWGALTVPVAFVAAVLVLVRTLALPGDADEREIGLWLGLAAVLGVLVGAWRSIGDQSFPRAVVTPVEVTPLPAPKARSDSDAGE